VYSIRSYQTNMVYIGSTTQSLAKRIGEHRRNYRKYLIGKFHNVSSFEIIKYKDNYIEITEEYSCQNKMELERREGQIIRITENCINKRIAGRTKQQYRIDNADKIKRNNKQYRIDNADTIKRNNKQYYQDNQDELKAKHNQYRIDNADKIKQYYQDNQDELKAKHNQYRIDNQDELKAKQKQKHNCDCGGKYTYSHQSRHFKSQKHINYLALTEIPLSSERQEPNQSPIC